jgi:hypothetical protein
LSGGTGDEVGVAFGLQLAGDGGADHASVAGYIYFTILIHREHLEFA